LDFPPEGDVDTRKLQNLMESQQLSVLVAVTLSYLKRESTEGSVRLSEQNIRIMALPPYKTAQSPKSWWADGGFEALTGWELSQNLTAARQARFRLG